MIHHQTALVLRLPTKRTEGVAQQVGTQQTAIMQQTARLFNKPAHCPNMTRVCMLYGDGTAGIKLAQPLKN